MCSCVLIVRLLHLALKLDGLVVIAKTNVTVDDAWMDDTYDTWRRARDESSSSPSQTHTIRRTDGEFAATCA